MSSGNYLVDYLETEMDLKPRLNCGCVEKCTCDQDDEKGE